MVQKSNIKSDATKKIHGFEYQKFVALEMCLDAGENEILYLECYGDVASKTTSTEVKHHHGKTSLSDGHIDFWKTLHNWVVDFPLYLSFSRLVLFTTAEIKEDTIFWNWNHESALSRLQKIKSVVPGKTVHKYFKYIFEFGEEYDQDILLKILEKVEIRHSQLQIKEFVKVLESKGMMKGVEPKWRKTVLCSLFGYLSTQAVNDSFIWKVDVNDFMRSFRYIVREFAKGDLPFPYVEKDEVQVIDNEYRFVREIKKIKCSDYKVTRAIQDFLRSNETLVRLLEATPMLCKNIQQFDVCLEDMIIDRKDSAVTIAADSGMTESELMPLSRKLYDECIGEPPQTLRGVQAIEKYFQTGRIHSVVENGEFTWQIRKEDLDEA